MVKVSLYLLEDKYAHCSQCILKFLKTLLLFSISSLSKVMLKVLRLLV
jgi:hypothetical protein